MENLARLQRRAARGAFNSSTNDPTATARTRQSRQSTADTDFFWRIPTVSWWLGVQAKIKAYSAVWRFISDWATSVAENGRLRDDARGRLR